MSSISIGVLTYQRIEHLISLLEDLQSVDFAIEVILINNNETIDVYNDIKEYFNNGNISLNYIWDKINYGVAKGRRRIVESCNTDYLILFDDDVHLPDVNKLLAQVQNEFDNNIDAGGIAFNIIEYTTKTNNRYEIPHKNKKINLSANFYTYLMIGAGMALRTSTVKEIGNFSNELGPYGFEEVDISFRLINNGKYIKYLCDCVVEHKKSPDGRFSSALVNYYAFINRTIIAKRHLRGRYFLSCLLVRSIFFLAKTRDLKLLLQGLKVISSFKTREPFSQNFYDYCKKVKAFLYY